MNCWRITGSFVTDLQWNLLNLSLVRLGDTHWVQRLCRIAIIPDNTGSIVIYNLPVKLTFPIFVKKRLETGHPIMLHS